MTNLPAPISDDLMVGFEDFDNSDIVMPRLKLDHTEGVMVDTLSGETFTEAELVFLGNIKGRILWPAEVSEDKTGPLCQSLNFTQGLPDRDKFPWKASGFKPAEYPADAPLPCDGCQLKEWETHPQGGKPWCSELFTLALMLPAGDGWTPALLTLQRSAIKATRAYMTAFMRQKTPLFVTTTKLSLQQLRRGSVKYVVPQFAKGSPTDPELHAEFADHYRRIRTFVQTPREEKETTDTGAAPTAKSAAATDDDDKLDW